jgi:hypothetical protein
MPLLAILVALAITRPAGAQPAISKAQIDKAIAAGVAYLKGNRLAKLPVKTQNWETDIGASALVGWTLLECGVSQDDPVMKNLTANLRQAAVGEFKNYNLSLLLIFLDRLADAGDIPLIEALAVRLLGSQTRDGGWAYVSDQVGAAEQRYLAGVVQGRKDARGKDAPRTVLPRTFKQLRPETKQLLQQLGGRFLPPNHPSAGNGGDNSNTQFAMIALWIAGRYGMPVQEALMLTGKRFQAYQNKDGSWPYKAEELNKGGQLRSQAMTCAGLIGLALGQASTPPGRPRLTRDQLLQEPAVKAGLSNLGKVLRREMPSGEPKWSLYFYWSLERTAVLYELKEIDRVDWYAVGARTLVGSQGRDGSWSRGTGHDTCFALLFLRRVNVVQDVTELLNQQAIEDPKK